MVSSSSNSSFLFWNAFGGSSTNRRQRDSDTNNNDSTNSPSNDTSSLLHRERTEGQALLRQMVLRSDDEQVDWDQVIAKAHQLHQREQALLKTH